MFGWLPLTTTAGPLFLVGATVEIEMLRKHIADAMHILVTTIRESLYDECETCRGSVRQPLITEVHIYSLGL